MFLVLSILEQVAKGIRRFPVVAVTAMLVLLSMTPAFSPVLLAQDLPDPPPRSAGKNTTAPRPSAPPSRPTVTVSAGGTHGMPSQLTPPTNGKLIMLEDFSDMQTGWPIGESPTAVWGYNRGGYMINLRGTGRVRTENDSVVEQGVMVPRVAFRDFCLDFHMSLLSSAHSYLEIRFRTSTSGFYTLAINSRKQFSITRFDGQYRTLLQSRKSESLGTRNDIRVMMEGSRILIYANGTPIAACRDANPLPSGGLIFLAGLASGTKLVDSTTRLERMRLYTLPLTNGDPTTETPVIASAPRQPTPQPNTPDATADSSMGASEESPYAPPARQNNRSNADRPIAVLPGDTSAEPLATPIPPAPASTDPGMPPPPDPAPTLDTPVPPPAPPAPPVKTVPDKQDLANLAISLDKTPPATPPATAPAPAPEDAAQHETPAIPDDKPKARRPKTPTRSSMASNATIPGYDVFPLKANNYWIFEGTVKYDAPEGSEPLANPNPASGAAPAPAAATGKHQEKAVRWRMDVIDTAVVDGWGFALIKGYPADLSSYEEGREPSESLIVRDPEGRYYLVQREDITEQLVTLQSGTMERFQKPGGDELILCPPFTRDAQFGSEQALRREGTTNRWVYTGEGNTKVSHIQGFMLQPGAADSRPTHTLEFRTNQDVTIAQFSPGIGLTSYKYTHIASGTESDVRIVECRIQKP